LEPLDYLNALRRRWVLIAALAVFGALVAAITTPATSDEEPGVSEVRTYRATHTLIRDSAPTVQNRVDLGTASLLIRVGEVPKRVAAKIGSDVPGPVLAASVQTQVDSEVGTITVTVEDSNQRDAERLANEFATEAITYLDEREQERQRIQLDVLSKRLDDLQTQIGALEGRIVDANERDGRILRAQRDALIRTYGTTFEQFQNITARGPDRSGLLTLEEAIALPISRGGFQPPATRTGRMLLGAALGVLLGAGIAILLERLDTRLRSKEEAEQALQLPVLGEIPVLSRPQQRRQEIETIVKPSSATAEAYRGLRASIRMLPAVRVPGQGPASIVMVTSPGPREGKTSTVASLATTFARAGETVVCVDFDTRRPELHRAFGMPDDTPAIHTLDGMTSEEIAAMAQQTPVPNVRIIRIMGEPAELLSQAHRILAAAARHADVVLVDSPPLLATTDARELLPTVDATLLVCRVGRTPVGTAIRADELLQRAGGRALGIVLVGVPKPPAHWRYYYEEEPDDLITANGANGTVTAPARPNGQGGAAAPASGSVPSVTATPDPDPYPPYSRPGEYRPPEQRWPKEF
jgi:Mrp family chromosome partitioning ATPase